MNAYQHLFFDLDHTIWDFETNSKETLHEIFYKHQLDKKITNDFDGFYERYAYHNKKLWDRYHHGFIKQEELKWKRMWLTLLDFKETSEALAREYSVEYLQILPTKKQLFPHTKELLGYLTDKHYTLHLITNGFEDVQRGKLSSSGIGHYFSQVITSEKAMALKPNAEIFSYALQAAKATAPQSIMIGDNLDADIKGAMDAGWHTVFVNHIHEKTELKPTFIVHHLQEMENIF